MIGRLDPHDRKVTVVGGGISGLLAAYVLSQKGYEVSLYEAESRTGGLIQTVSTPHGISETAAHSLLVTGTVQAFFDELGVPLVPVNPDSQARFIYRDQKFSKFPLRFFEGLGLIIRVLFRLNFSSFHKMTLKEWGNRFLGHAATDHLLFPFVRGIYAVTPSELSVAAAFPSLKIPFGVSFGLSRIVTALRNFFTRKPRVRSKMMAPAYGMSDLVGTLENEIKSKIGSSIHLGNGLKSLPASGNVVLCVPALAASSLLKSASPELSRALSEVRYSPLITATVFVQKRYLNFSPNGVGVLMGPDSKLNCLGVLFNSSAFFGRTKDKTTCSFTVMLGGSQSPEMCDLPKEEVNRMIQKDLSFLFGLKGPLDHVELRVWKKAIPCYNQQLLETWELASRSWCGQKGHVLFGNYTGQVSLRGMIESVSKTEWYQ